MSNEKRPARSVKCSCGLVFRDIALKKKVLTAEEQLGQHKQINQKLDRDALQHVEVTKEGTHD